MFKLQVFFIYASTIHFLPFKQTVNTVYLIKRYLLFAFIIIFTCALLGIPLMLLTFSICSYLDLALPGFLVDLLHLDVLYIDVPDPLNQSDRYGGTDSFQPFATLLADYMKSHKSKDTYITRRMFSKNKANLL